jgi:hypothetical protein
VSGPDRDEDQRAGREAIPADDVVSDRHALHVPDRWVQTHRLLKAGARPGQSLDVVVGGDATVQYGVDLGLQPLSRATGARIRRRPQPYAPRAGILCGRSTY